MSAMVSEGLIVETHNWGKSVAFWHDFGYDLEHSLLFRHPAGGPCIFLVEQRIQDVKCRTENHYE